MQTIRGMRRVWCALLMATMILPAAPRAAYGAVHDSHAIIADTQGSGIVVLAHNNSVVVGQHVALCDAQHQSTIATFTEADAEVQTMDTSAKASGTTLVYTAGMAVFDVEDGEVGAVYLRHKDRYLSAGEEGKPLYWSGEADAASTWIPEALPNGKIVLKSRLDSEKNLYMTFEEGTATVTADRDAVSIAYFGTSEHVFDELVVEATCTRDGSITRTCIACGAMTTRSIPVLGHDWGPWTVVKKGTETDGGVEMRYCLRDSSHVETRTIPEAGASDSEAVVVSYDLDGGSIDGLSDTFSVTYASGTEVKMLEAPVREGYEFLYWESPHYRLESLDTFVAQSNESFKAIWKEAASGTTTEGNQQRSSADTPLTSVREEDTTTAATGDSSIATMAMVALFVFCGIPLIIMARVVASNHDRG